MSKTCHPSSTCSEPYVLVIITRRNMTVTAPTQESNSYRTPGTFLLVILERMVGSVWNLLREQCCWCRRCAWVIGRSLNRWRWVALVFNAQVYTALQDGVISQNLWTSRSADLTSQGFFLWSYLKNGVYRRKSRIIEALKDNIRLNITHNEKVVLRQMQRCVRMCLVAGGGHFKNLMWSQPVRHEFLFLFRFL
jgi:hypothetical protein